MIEVQIEEKMALFVEKMESIFDRRINLIKKQRNETIKQKVLF